MTVQRTIREYGYRAGMCVLAENINATIYASIAGIANTHTVFAMSISPTTYPKTRIVIAWLFTSVEED
jgi:hypothetical protein